MWCSAPVIGLCLVSGQQNPTSRLLQDSVESRSFRGQSQTSTAISSKILSKYFFNTWHDPIGCWHPQTGLTSTLAMLQYCLYQPINCLCGGLKVDNCSKEVTPWYIWCIIHHEPLVNKLLNNRSRPLGVSRPINPSSIRTTSPLSEKS